MKWTNISMFLRIEKLDINLSDLVKMVTNESSEKSLEDFNNLYNMYNSFSGVYKVSQRYVKNPILRRNGVFDVKKTFHVPSQDDIATVNDVYLTLPSQVSQMENLLENREVLGTLLSTGSPIMLRRQSFSLRTYSLGGLQIDKSSSGTPEFKKQIPGILSKQFDRYFFKNNNASGK